MAANASYVSLQLGFLHGSEQVHESDHTRYIAMAQGPVGYANRRDAHLAPFCYRVLVPWLAYGLTRAGLSVDAAFYLLSQLSSAGLLATLFLLLRASGLRRADAALGVGLAALLPGLVRWYAYQYWMTDPLALWLVALAFLAIRLGRHSVLAPLGTLALLARESYLLVLPYLFLRLWRREGLGAACARTAAAFAVPIAVMLLVRDSIIAVPARPLGIEIERIIEFRSALLLENQLYLWSIGSFGVLFAALWLPTARGPRGWLRRPEDLAVIAAVYGSLLIASNTDRLLVYAVPVILPVAVRSVRRLAEASGLPFAALAGSALLAQAVFYLRTRFSGPEISNLQPFDGVATLVVVGWWLGCTLAWAFSARGGSGRGGGLPPPSGRPRRVA